MLSLVAVLLTAAPGHASLLSPAEPELRPSARLLAQATPEANPEPGTGSTPPPLVTAPEERIQELTLRVNELNDRIRALKTDWPLGSVVMLYAGYVLSPLILVGLPLFIFGLSSAAEIAGTLAAIGAVISFVGAAGIGLLIAGVVTGISSADAARVEKKALISERTRLEDELRELKRRRDPATLRWSPEPPARAFTVASVSF